MWKIAEVVTIMKPGITEVSARSYRPICLLNILGKVLQRLMLSSLNGVLDKLSPYRFGGRRGKSTIDAVQPLLSLAETSRSKYVMIILYDIAGAFDNLWWPVLLNQLRILDCPRNIFKLISSFLTGRIVYVNLPNGQIVRRVERGCAQGSILGLPLWNICLDPLLWRIRAAGYLPSAYVDDIGVAIEASSRVDIETKATDVTEIIQQWCEENKLSLNSDKTQLMLLKGKMSDKWLPSFRVGRSKIRPSRQVKFLGVNIGERCNFVNHLKEIQSKTALRFCCLGQIASASWGLGYKNRDILYKAAYLPLALYAAPIWGKRLKRDEKRLLQMSQRRALLLVTGAYRTAPTSALQVISLSTSSWI